MMRASAFMAAAAFSVLLSGGCDRPGRTTDGGTVRPQEQEGEALPSFDREQFRASAESIARADLLACRNPKATFSRLSDADPEEFGRTLHGTWVGSRRTVHGMPVVLDLVFLVDLRGEKGAAILIDRNNLEAQLLPAFAQTTRTDQVRATDVYTFVDCTFNFIDEYVKVSDDVSLPTLARATGVSLDGVRDLRGAWDRLVSSGYFDGFEMRVGGDSTRTMKGSQLGDEQRVALLPTGRVVSEREIAQGLAPGAEYRLPMVTGGYFDVSLTRVTPEGRRNTGIEMRWEAVYRGAGINIPENGEVRGVERGLFLKEGGAYVSAVSELGTEVWSTSACADKNGLDAFAQVSNPDPTHSGHEHENFVFTRVVLGTP